MRLIVFGANGQLGRELARASLPRGAQLSALGREQVSITDEVAVRRVLEPADVAFVINAAAYTAVDRAEAEAEVAWQVNRDGPRILALACAARGVPMLHVSTDYVFDGLKPTPYVEDDPINPLGVYGASKAAGEAAVRGSLSEHIILRTSWVFSAFGQNFVKTMLRLASEREELRVVADQFGRPTPAADLAAAIIGIATRPISAATPWGSYHYAGAGRASWFELASAIIDLQAPITGRRPRVKPITTADYPTPVRRPANSELDCSRFELAFGRRPSPWSEGLSVVVSELLARDT